MITKITFNKKPPYKQRVEFKPKKVNFIFGANGSGKTTIAAALDWESSQACADLEWANNRQMPVIVFNKEFKEKNLRKEGIDGIFTLGEDEKGTKDIIDSKIQEQQRLEEKLDSAKGQLDKSVKATSALRSTLMTTCWGLKDTYDKDFEKALTGFKGSKADFLEKCLLEHKNLDTNQVKKYEDIKLIYDAAFSADSKIYTEVPAFKTLAVLEDSPLLSKAIIGSGSSTFGDLIQALNNSDWVKQGLEYANMTQNKCPYCQQTLTAERQSSIEKYFDVQYEEDCTRLSEIVAAYKDSTDKYTEALKRIMEETYPFFDVQAFAALSMIIKSEFSSNIKALENKLRSPSAITKISSTANILEDINNMIERLNDSIRQNNEAVNNKATAKEICKKMVWLFIADKLKSSIDDYHSNCSNPIKEQDGLRKHIISIQTDISTLKQEIIQNQKKLTSVKPTVDSINSILETYGFTDFKLEQNSDDKTTYKIVRNNGDLAFDSLSEGEEGLLTFLYYYHLTEGSHSPSDTKTSIVAVIDDPVSSLDGGSLFIVSTLIRQMIEKCSNDPTSKITQVFVLTHNVFFHKELTHTKNRHGQSNDRIYFVIRKINSCSTITAYTTNPIQTSYELMWAEVYEAQNSTTPPITVFNTLRRILEYYFSTIGYMGWEEQIALFDGQNQIICRALISWMHDGSHNIFDDLSMCHDAETTTNYLRIFKEIFEKSNHGGHYEMMMKKCEENNNANTAIDTVSA